MRFATSIGQAAADLQRLGEVRTSFVPFREIFVHSTQVVQRHGLLALESGLALNLQCALIDLARLRLVAEAVVEDGDAIERCESVLRHAQFLEERLRVPQVAEP
mgnify:CR=1 FL=1